MVSDGNGGNQLATNTLTISPLNDAPERVAGNVSTLFLVEDAPLTSMGLEDVEYVVGGGSDESSGDTAQTLTYTVSSVPADTVGRIYTADDGTTTSDVGVLSGQMKGDGTTGFAVSAASMVDSSGEYQDLTLRGIAGLTINDDGSYSFDAQDAFYNGVTTAAGVVSGELIGAGTAGYEFASATTRDGLTGDFQDVVGDVAGLTINDDGSFSFNTLDAAYDDLADGDTRQINVIYNFTSGVETKTEDLIISLTGTATDPTAEILSGAHVGVAAGETLNIRGTYEYVSTAGGATVSNEFVISIAGTTDTERTATFRSAVSNQQELSLSELRSLQFLAAENASGLADFTFEVTDSGAVSDGNGNENLLTQTLTLDILNFNDIPELPEVQIVFDGTQTKQSGQEDTDYTFTAADLLAGVVDPDILYNQDGSVQERPYGDILVVDSLSVTNGSVDDDGLGNYTFTPDDNFYGTARINYLIKDGQGGSISNLVELTIDSVNDAPIATFATDQNTAEGNSAIGGQLTSTDVDTHATAEMTGDIPNPESAEYSYVSAFIDDFDSSFAAGELSASLKHADGTALLATETVQFVDAKFTTTAGVTTEVTDIASIGGLTIDPNGSLTLDTSGAFYDGLATADDLIEIIVKYSVDNSDTSTSTTNEFRIHVTSDAAGTTREATLCKEVLILSMV